MATDRRTFLASALALLAAAPATAPASRPGPRLLACRRDADGAHHASAFDATGTLLYSTPLPGRGHGIAVHPDGRTCAVAARRPGRFLLVLDAASGRVRHRVASPEDRHFCGHGAFAADGRLLFTTENDYTAGRGVIGIYDTGAGFRRVGELPSHGVGPHELRLLPDGRTLAVANGGILTHPDYGRAKLNLDTMAPSLAFVDARDGRLLEAWRLPGELHQLSIRHLDLRGDGTVALAMQHQGPASEAVPLIGLKPPGEGIRLLEPPRAIAARMRNYCGSVRFDAAGERFAVSAPRGGLVTLWSRSGHYLGHLDLPDGCGIAPDPGGSGFALSSGAGKVVFTGGGRPAHTLRFSASHWDNHMVALS